MSGRLDLNQRPLGPEPAVSAQERALNAKAESTLTRSLFVAITYFRRLLPQDFADSIRANGVAGVVARRVTWQNQRLVSVFAHFAAANPGGRQNPDVGTQEPGRHPRPQGPA